MDSVTRFAMAQREVGLAAGEPPTAKGYPPSVFALLPGLLERAGNVRGRGSITALYTVLVEGDDTNEPIADAVRGILDGHIVLSRDLAGAQSLPGDRHPAEHQPHDARRDRRRRTGAAPAQVREWLATLRDSEDLVSVGAYVPGTTPRIDAALERRDAIAAVPVSARRHAWSASPTPSPRCRRSDGMRAFRFRAADRARPAAAARKTARAHGAGARSRPLRRARTRRWPRPREARARGRTRRSTAPQAAGTTPWHARAGIEVGLSGFGTDVRAAMRRGRARPTRPSGAPRRRCSEAHAAAAGARAPARPRLAAATRRARDRAAHQGDGRTGRPALLQRRPPTREEQP